MKKKKSWIDKLVYRITKKPDCYKEVKNPPKTVVDKLLRPQEARQEQYNKWSKIHQVYSGLYLPYRAEELEKRGWIKKAIPKNKSRFNEEFVRKSTGQEVLRHGRHKNNNGGIEKTYYHWKNPGAEKLPKREKRENYYFNKYGEVCARKSEESHIKPHITRRKIK